MYKLLEEFSLIYKFFFILLLHVVLFVPLKAQLVPFKFSEESQKWGFKNRTTNEIIIYWHFSKADSFNKYGLAKVTYHNRQGCIDTSGKIVVPFYYQSLVNCNRDTVLVNTKKNKYLVRKNNDYYEYIGGVQFTDFPLSYWAKKEQNIIVFSYPRDQELVQNVITHDREKDLKPLSPKISNELSFTSIGSFNSNKTKYWPANSLQIKYTKLLDISITGKRRGNLGISTGYLVNRYWVDTAVIKTNQLFAGLNQRLYLSNSVFINIGVYPIINQTLKSHQRGATKWNVHDLNYSLSSSFESSLNFILGNNFCCGLGYKFIPTPYYRDKLQHNFFSFNIGFQFE